MILLVAMWGARETGLVSDPAIAVSGVERCLSILNEFSARHHTLNRGMLVKPISPLSPFRSPDLTTSPSFRGVIEVLIAPRVDYLAESLTARAEREHRIEEAKIRAATWSSDDGDFEVRPLIRAARWNYELDHRGHGGGAPYLHATEKQHHDGHYQHPVSASREQGGLAPFTMPLQPLGPSAPLMGLPWLDAVDFFGGELPVTFALCALGADIKRSRVRRDWVAVAVRVTRERSYVSPLPPFCPPVHAKPSI